MGSFRLSFTCLVGIHQDAIVPHRILSNEEILEVFVAEQLGDKCQTIEVTGASRRSCKRWSCRVGAYIRLYFSRIHPTIIVDASRIFSSSATFSRDPHSHKEHYEFWETQPVAQFSDAEGRHEADSAIDAEKTIAVRI